MAQRLDFFVFEKLQWNVILGRPFLHDTGTLDIHQSRLRQVEIAPNPTSAVRCVGQAGECVQCWLDGEPAWALPDTGADINLISLTFAQALGFNEGKGKHIDCGNRIDVELAGGFTVTTEGTIQFSVSFSSPKERNPIVYELVESSNKRILSHENREIQPNSQFRETFHVLAGLEHEVILGETLLTTVDVYQRHTDNFSSSEKQEPEYVAIARVKKGGEGKKGCARPLDAERKFHDEYSLETDRHLEEKEAIEGKLTRGYISDNQARVKLDQNDRQHVLWVMNNEVPMKLYCPGFYEKIVPQELAQHTD